MEKTSSTSMDKYPSLSTERYLNEASDYKISLTDHQKAYIYASLESSAKQIFETEVMYTNASLQNNEVEALDQIDNLRNALSTYIPQEPSEMLKSSSYSSTSKPISAYKFLCQPMLTAYFGINDSNICNPCDRIGRNLSISAAQLTMKVAKKNMKLLLNTDDENKHLHPIALAPFAIHAGPRIKDVAKTSKNGKFPVIEKAEDKVETLPVKSLPYAVRDEHRSLRTSEHLKSILPKKFSINVDTLKDNTDSDNFDLWDPVPVIKPLENNSMKVDLELMTSKDRLERKRNNLLRFNRFVEYLIQNGIETSTGAGNRLSVIEMTNKMYDSIQHKINLDIASMSSSLNEIKKHEMLQQKLDFQTVIARSCAQYLLLDSKLCERYNIENSYLYDDAYLDLWTDRQYQLPEFRILRQTSIDSEQVLKCKLHFENIFCGGDKVIRDIQNYWFDSSMPLKWFEKMEPMKPCNYNMMSFLDISEMSFRKKLPMEIKEFTDHIQSKCRHIVDGLIDEWIANVGNILSEAIADMTNADAIFCNIPTAQPEISSRSTESLYRNKGQRVVDTACALLSQQIRFISENSLLSFAKFFVQHQHSEIDINDHSAFIIHLKAKNLVNNDILNSFSTPSSVCLFPGIDILSDAINNIIKSLVELFSDFVRPERIVGKEFGGRNKLLIEQNIDSSLNSASVKLHDSIVSEVTSSVLKTIKDLFEAPKSLLKKFEVFNSLLDGSLMKSVEDAIVSYESSQSLSELDKYLADLETTKNLIKTVAPDISYFPLFEVHCHDVKILMLEFVQNLQHKVLDTVCNSNRSHMQTMMSSYVSLSNGLMAEAINAFELRDLQQFTQNAENQIVQLNAEYFDVCVVKLKFLLSYEYKLTKENMGIVAATAGWQALMQNYLRRSRDMQASRKKDLLELLEEEQHHLESDVIDISRRIENVASKEGINDFRKIIESIQSIRSSIESVLEFWGRVHETEDALEVEHSDVNVKIEEIKLNIDPLERLWSTVKLYLDKNHYWRETPLEQMNSEEEEKQAEDLAHCFNKLAKEFGKFNEKRLQCKTIANNLLAEVKEWIRDYVPLTRLICNPGMQPRHWLQIEKVTGISFPKTKGTVFTMQLMIDLGLHHFTAQIEDICVSASKEYGLKLALDKMEKEWQEMNFETKEYRNTGARILCSIDEVQQLLDDQLVKIMAMKSSRFIKPLLERLTSWETILLNMQEILDNWLKVQVTWLYLEPIFSSDDIMRQMPIEAKLFRTVDTIWRSSMIETFNEPNCIQVAKRQGFLKILIEANEMLEKIQKGLNDYLETKRLAFPRFFFLSNDELLEILAETKDPLRVQPHLRKCFDGINSLEFQSNLDITACFDPKGEKLDFPYFAIQHKKINPSEFGGNVEKWLIEVEAVMKKSLSFAIDSSMAAFLKSDKLSWLQNWQGQVIICVNQTYWCRDVESILSKSNATYANVAEYHNHLCDELLRTVELVRGNIPKSLRVSIGALVVMDVHNRDTTGDLVNLSVSSKNDFDWLAQLRYYWNANGNSTLTGKPDTIQCCMINATVQYAYEYIGNQDRLVITPLTDRCYRTLMMAIHLNLGGAPEGPAGTGKTETTKDLAKAVAIQCIVTNCSDGLDYLAMAKFFKGLASSGSWACFDEFNRIQLEVLSVVAQQILQIQIAKLKGVSRFNFEGTDLDLKPTCCPFITMNPGYAGRAELPDNLKVLFRTVAMMVPDYAMISEIILYSYGYTTAKPLAVKIVTTYKLCSEQLSSQSHYDYGMRAVIAVLRAAGNLKRSFSHLSEEVLVLRSIVDVNLPKFLSPDVPLFYGIVSDLFPNVTVEAPDLKLMREAFDTVCKKHLLINEEYFWEKIIQIYDMMIVRHGFMIVGMPFSGKSSAWKVLSDMIGLLHDKFPEDKQWSKVYTFIQNPKSISMGQLYGQFDAVTHEWTDGVLAINFRNAASNRIGSEQDRKWIIFDGPVDALWIENLNTVLDDNKKLCLMSGEIIAMTDAMSMIFEPMDLLAASPATVSRCGMIYMESEKLGWKPLILAWLQRFSSSETDVMNEMHLDSEDASHVIGLVDRFMDPCLSFVRKEVNELSPTVDCNLVMSFLNLFEALCIPLKSKTYVATEDNSKSPDYWDDLNSMFFFSIIWTIGISSDHVSRKKFSKFLFDISESCECINASYANVWNGLQLKSWKLQTSAVALMNFQKIFQSMQSGNEINLYAYYYDILNSSWRAWSELLMEYSILADASFGSIVVPTTYTAQYQYILQLLLPRQRNVLICSPTGTGKSVYINNFIYNVLPRSDYKAIGLGFSARTSANMTQGIVDGKLDKRRKGVYGPPVGQKCIIFVDDVNMPEVEQYGAQPPIELLRQLLDNKGWYDLKEKSWKSICDTCIIGALGPSGGRSSVTPRFLRHFNLLCFNEFDENTMRKIFSVIVESHFNKGFSADVSMLSNTIVDATLSIYQQSLSHLLPTPMKSHYTFNLRDFSRIIQGVLLCSPSDSFKPPTLTKLWLHETLRVIGDRLVDDSDRQWLHSQFISTVSIHFHSDLHEVCRDLKSGEDSFGDEVSFSDTRRLIFGSFMQRDDSNSSTNSRYEEISDIALLNSRIDEYLDEYNQVSRKPMDLVMFSFAIEHVSRISRILNLPGGNALVVGIGGSGRQSLTKLATFMCSYEIFQIEISKSYSNLEWREDLKRLLRMAGCGSKPITYLFSDTQIKNESFVEDINNILNYGEVPNIFPTEEISEIVESMRPIALKRLGKAAADMTQQDLYSFFIQRIKENLHIVLAFSPIGDAFRDRLRKFPALINGCTIDWMTSWPSDALIAVANKFLADVDFESDETKHAIVSLCKRFHEDIVDLSNVFFNNLKRRNYVTPTSYLELILAYKANLQKRRNEVSQSRMRYESGLQKLVFAAEQVNAMQKELESLLPQLAQSKLQTGELMKQIESKMPSVIKTREVVGQEASIAQQEADIVQGQKNEVEADLAVAMPALEAAIDALNTIKPADINEIKALSNPPAKIKTVCKAVCYMLGISSNRIPDPNDPSKRIQDYWGPSQKMLSDSQFITKLFDYDKDNIPPSVVQKIQTEFINDPNSEFTPEKIVQASKAAEGMCKWVLALITYDKVVKVVAPKKAALATAEERLQMTMNALNEKKAELRGVEEELKGLEDELDAAKNYMVDLERQVKLCESKISRATQLLDGLGGERERWGLFATNLIDQCKRLTGDVFLSSGVLAYLGPFTATYRQKKLSEWIHLLKERGIACSDNPTLASTLGNAVTIRQWHIDGLPTDNFSIDNGIIVFNARRWPLMIDPQGQANKWIRNMEKSNGLQVIRLSDANYLRTLENAIQFGIPVLLENIGEELDPSLEPLLQKQIFKQGGVYCIRLGDSTIEYSDSFRFYMTTKLRNPHYLPEISVKVTLLNFMITPEGLQDQLLGIVVSQERPDLEEQRNALIVQSAENNRLLQDIEDRILYIMSNSSGNILEDETAISTLNDSKRLSDEIKNKQEIARETEMSIDLVRQSYTTIAYSSQILFFCIADLANIEPVYQYSLAWFTKLFIVSIKQSDKGRDVAKRLANLNDHFTYSLYRNVCRSLLEKDKLLFSFLLTTRIMMGKSMIDAKEWFFLLTGGGALPANVQFPSNPAPEWLSQKIWESVCKVSYNMKKYSNFCEDFMEHIDEWKRFYDSNSSHNETFPGIFASADDIGKLCALQAIRPDKLINSLQDFVKQQMSDKFIKPPAFDIQACYEDSSATVPLIFILSPGSDPMGAVIRAAEILHNHVDMISLGQGQGSKAEKLIARAKEKGTWVVLQNCHLAPSFMPTLEKICEELDPEDIHPNFRLWCTTYPSETFPVSVLQNGVKMTNAAPKGIRANLLGSYKMDPISNEDFFASCKKGFEFRRLLFGLCFFHALVQERRLYGPLGWNIPYEFNESDLRISVQQLVLFLNESEEAIPFKALRYTAGECNYGGRVTDDKDRRTLACILERFYHPSFCIEDESEVFISTQSSDFMCPRDGNYDDYLEFIDKLPLVASPDIFGLHDNATLTKNTNDANILLNSMLSTEDGVATSSGGGNEKETLISSLAADIKAKTPLQFDLELAQIRYPVIREESMHTVLHQELIRFNNLLSMIHESLDNIQKAIKGLIVMSSELEVFGNALYVNRIPTLWKSRSYPSLKTLAGYISDQQERLEFFSTWLNDQPPAVYWISGFFFTQAFMTGAAQNYARKYTIPIDNVVFDFKMMTQAATDITEGPVDGVFTQGLFLEGARWNMETLMLDESLPKVLFSPAPLMHWVPYRKEDIPSYPHYQCPVYKTSDRRGVLATTGHSSNFVCYIFMPSDIPETHWIQRGVALLTQLDD